MAFTNELETQFTGEDKDLEKTFERNERRARRFEKVMSGIAFAGAGVMGATGLVAGFFALADAIAKSDTELKTLQSTMRTFSEGKEIGLQKINDFTEGLMSKAFGSNLITQYGNTMAEVDRLAAQRREELKGTLKGLEAEAKDPRFSQTFDRTHNQALLGHASANSAVGNPAIKYAEQQAAALETIKEQIRQTKDLLAGAVVDDG